MRSNEGTPASEAFARAPITAALNRIAIRALAGFLLVAGAALVPLIVPLDPGVHEGFHVVLPFAGVAFAVITGAFLMLRPSPPEPEAWPRAAAADPEMTTFARRVSILMTVGWLVSMGAVFMHHHLGTQKDVVMTLAVDVPLTLAVWILAVFAWNSWCRAHLARAEREADDRLREYWRSVAETRRA